MQLQVTNFRAVNKGSLQGFLDILLPELHWTIKGCGLFCKNERKWVSPPSRSNKDPTTGEIVYTDIIAMSKEDRAKFSTAALQAYKVYAQTPVSPQEMMDF